MSDKPMRVCNPNMFEMPEALLVYRKFPHRGMQVEEFLLAWEPKTLKLIWIRSPARAVLLENQVKNLIFYVDFPDYEELVEDNLSKGRKAIQDNFDRYWGIKPSAASWVLTEPRLSSVAEDSSGE